MSEQSSFIKLNFPRRVWLILPFDTGGEVKNDALSELEFVELQA